MNHPDAHGAQAMKPVPTIKRQRTHAIWVVTIGTSKTLYAVVAAQHQLRRARSLAREWTLAFPHRSVSVRKYVPAETKRARK